MNKQFKKAKPYLVIAVVVLITLLILNTVAKRNTTAAKVKSAIENGL